VRSLDEQSLPPDEYEVILVDDGSTDDTLSVARGLAADRPNLVVETIPNSGWPGRPRNVGLDRARGDYVFFSDHDDAFGPRALERMHAAAVEHGADVVYGKVVRQGRPTPYWPVWAQDVAVADPAGLPMQSRTVHKLYRRAFLLDHGIRFREGRIRLEDHEFMALVLARKPVISILASEPCYFWIHRSDRSNTSDTPIEPRLYWSFYDHVLTTWEQAAGPGDLLDAARLASAMQAFSRFPARSYLQRTPESRAALFGAVSDVFARHVPAELDARLPVLKRLRAQALRQGDRPRFDAVQEWRSELGFDLGTDAVSLADGQLRLAVTGRCRRGAVGGAVALDRPSTGPATLPGDEKISGSDADRALLDADLGTVELTIRHRNSGVEWPIPDQHSTRDAALTVWTDAVVDLDRTPFDAPLEPGIWDLYAHVQFLGETVAKRVAAPADGLPEPVRKQSSVYATVNGMLSFKVRRRITAAALRWRSGLLELRVEDAPGVVEVLIGPRNAPEAARRAAPVTRGRATVDPGGFGDVRTLDLWWRDAYGTTERLAYAGPTVPSTGTSPVLEAHAGADRTLAVTVSPTALGRLARAARARLRPSG
jgi:hypothetical protein